MAEYSGGGGGGGGGVSVFTWSFPGELNTTQNNDIVRYRMTGNATINTYDAQLVTASTGADVVVELRKIDTLSMDTLLSTLTIPAGSVFAKNTSLGISLVADEQLYVKITAVGTTFAGLTGLFRARA